MKKDRVGMTPLLVNQKGGAEGEFAVACVDVCEETFVGVEDMPILSNDNGIPFKESVGLMARQKKLIGKVGKTYRSSFCDFSGVTELRVVWVGHFSQAEKGKEASKQLCEKKDVVVVRGIS